MAKRGNGAVVDVSTMVAGHEVSGMRLCGSSGAAIILIAGSSLRLRACRGSTH
jgi:hypothetical protein